MKDDLLCNLLKLVAECHDLHWISAACDVMTNLPARLGMCRAGSRTGDISCMEKGQFGEILSVLH